MNIDSIENAEMVVINPLNPPVSGETVTGGHPQTLGRKIPAPLFPQFPIGQLCVAIVKRYILIPLAAFTLLLTLVPACTSPPKIAEGLTGYLESKANEALLRLRDNDIKYTSEVKKLQDYEMKMSILKNPIIADKPDIYGELELMIGYWVTDGKTMKNVCWTFASRKPVGDVEVYHHLHPTETFLTEMGARLIQVARCEEMLKWANICNSELKNLSVSFNTLETFEKMWVSGSNKTAVKRVSANIFSISGTALGLYSDKPGSGEWYYYQDSKKYEPEDKSAKNLFQLLNDIPTYEMKKAQSDIKTTPYDLPRREPCSYWFIEDYYASQYGLRMSTTPIDFKYSKNSDMVSKMFTSYPSLKIYWDTFEAIGFKVACATLHEHDAMLAPLLVPTSVKDTIILRVK